MIAKNTSAHDNITRVQSAIWGSSTFLKITNPEEESWAFEVTEAHETEKGAFLAKSIEDILAIKGWDSVDILKLDIEGSEIDVFNKGFESWLPKVKLLIIELHEKMKPGCTEVFERAVNQYDFNKTSFGENEVYVNKELN